MSPKKVKVFFVALVNNHSENRAVIGWWQVWICHDLKVPIMGRDERPPAVVLVCEMLSTTMEQMGAVYLFIPMLPQLSGNRVRAKHHHETEAPSLSEVMRAALAFSALHWSLRMVFMSEVNPLATLVKTIVAGDKAHWHECLMALWGQGLGVLIAQVYVINYYSPRKQRRG